MQLFAEVTADRIKGARDGSKSPPTTFPFLEVIYPNFLIPCRLP
jgi:hypothetical protein